MTTSEFKEQFFALAEKAEHIAITSHYSPDDDSIGSVLSMYAILTDKFPGKSVRIIYTGAKVERYKVFNNFDKIEWVDDVGNHLDGIDMLVMLDAARYERFSHVPENLMKVPVTIAMDHHASEPNEFTLLLLDPTASSNSELMYRALLEGAPLTREIAETILIGVLGDTGGFAYVKPEKVDTLILGASLVKTVGMPIDQFRYRYMGIPMRLIPLLQILIANMKYETIPGWPPVQYTHVPKELYEQGGYTDEDMSAASHIYMGQYLPRVEGYAWGFVVTPRSGDGCRMSSRSLPGSVNVRDLHERMGVGGGHDRASGAYFPTMSDPVDCISAVFEFMKGNEPVLR